MIRTVLTYVRSYYELPRIQAVSTVQSVQLHVSATPRREHFHSGSPPTYSAPAIREPPGGRRAARAPGGGHSNRRATRSPSHRRTAARRDASPLLGALEAEVDPCVGRLRVAIETPPATHRALVLHRRHDPMGVDRERLLGRRPRADPLSRGVLPVAAATSSHGVDGVPHPTARPAGTDRPVGVA